MDTHDDKSQNFNPFRNRNQAKQSTEDANVPAVQSPNTPPTLAQLETEIKFHLGQASQSIIEVGKRLTIAKSLVQHGEWRSWLENNFTLNERTAQRFMQISERFANKDVDVDGFKPSQLTEMLALPDATETEKFIEQKAAEGTPVPDMSVKTLRKEIKKWNAKKTSGTKANRLYLPYLLTVYPLNKSLSQKNNRPQRHKNKTNKQFFQQPRKFWELLTMMTKLSL